MTAALNQFLVPIGSFESYVAAVNRIPMLSAANEKSLAERYRHTNDLDAARQLVLSHLRFVVRVARGYQGYGLQQSDLVQEGNIGLMKAVKRFDPAMGVRLVSFAVHWIRAEMHEFILRNWRIVKVATTKAQRKLFFNLRSAKQRLGWLNTGEIDAVAKELGVDAKDVLLMEERLNAHDLTFEAPSDESNDELAPESYLTDSRFEPTQQLEALEVEHHSSSKLRQALAKLDSRSRDIVASRWLIDPKATLQDLAKKYQVSAERIRQLESNAITNMRKALGNDIALLLPAS
jgi:RNA polymerase sigma-32 factor